MKKSKLIRSIFSIGLISLAISSCNKNSDLIPDSDGHYSYKMATLDAYESKDYHITSENKEYSDLLSELNKRILRYDEDTKIGDIEIPEGATFNMGWQTSSIVWQNFTESGVGSDKITPIYKNFLKTMTQDDYGYMYDNAMFRESEFAQNNTGYVNLPQGWPFPYWASSKDDIFMDGTTYNDVNFCTFEFDTINDPTSDNWVSENGSNDIRFSGYMDLEVSGSIKEGESYRVYNESLSSLLTLKGGINTNYAPLLEIDLDFASSNLDDYYVIWKTKEGGDTWFKASSKEYVTIYNDYFKSYSARTYWPMYLNENWANKTVTAIGLEFTPKTGTTLNLENSRVKYIRPAYDTRQPQFTFQWLESFYDYVMYTRDLTVLKELMPKARKSLMYLLHCLSGEDGVLNLDYLYGHSGIGATLNSDGSVSFDTSTGIGSSYFDVLALPEINLESNLYFYQALNEMIKLEKAVEDNNIKLEDSYIKNREIGKEKVKYEMTSSSLIELASKVKTKLESEVNPVKQSDGTYTNEGGLWNSETGRFALGVRESDGKVLDHGYVYFNEQAIIEGLGTSDQQLSIMKWIDGQRVVEGDISTKDDIYFFEFAPRFTTADNTEQINFPLAKAFFGEDSNYEKYGTLFGRQVQCGGAILCWSYYDLLARKQVLGSDNASERLNEIVDWYKKVKENTTGEGIEFFKSYYDELEANDGNGYYVIQNADDTPGAIGVDGEFLENSLFAKAIPGVMFGMDVEEFDTLVFVNDSYSDMKSTRIDNLKFGNATYSIQMEKGAIEISNIYGGVNANTKVKLKFKKPSNDFKVIVDGYAISEYETEGDYVVVTTSLKKTQVVVK